MPIHCIGAIDEHITVAIGPRIPHQNLDSVVVYADRDDSVGLVARHRVFCYLAGPPQGLRGSCFSIRLPTSRKLLRPSGEIASRTTKRNRYENR